MRNKKIFVLKIVWRKSIASLHRLTQAVQRANLKRTAGDPTWVFNLINLESKTNRYLSMSVELFDRRTEQNWFLVNSIFHQSTSVGIIKIVFSSVVEIVTLPFPTKKNKKNM